jgi:hypothetical protein
MFAFIDFLWSLRPLAVKGNVKETVLKATEFLTSEGHRFEAMANQATAGMKPKRVSALIQRGALR